MNAAQNLTSPGGLRVLVADDIPASRHLLTDMVRGLGHVCLEADSGASTVQCAVSEHPDIILLDLLMPDFDGFEVTRRIREQITDRWLPVIVTSSLQGDEHFIHALSQGADDFLARPVNEFLLDAKLRHYQRVLALQASFAMFAERQRAIHEHIADAIITVDAEERICEANIAARLLLEKGSGEEPIGRLLAHALGVSPESLESNCEIQVALSQGRTIPLGVSVSAWAIGSHRFRTLALRDLTESKRVERMKDEFLATVSHELRTPLTSIVGALGLLSAGAVGELRADASELIAVARRNGERLSRLIDDVLDLTKLEGKRMVLVSRTVALDPLLAEAVETNKSYADQAAVKLSFLPRASGANATVDPDRFLQVIANLLSNAIKHSAAGQVVAIELYGERQNWRIDVTDEGSGIDPAFHARLFEKFAQADSSDRRMHPGTGLGLYISRMLVERMGGEIFAQSNSGKGSMFSVVLPRAAQAIRGPWFLCVAKSKLLQRRFVACLSSMGRCEAVMDASAAEALVVRMGSPPVLQVHGDDSGFVETSFALLRRLAPDATILAVSDRRSGAIDAEPGLNWVGDGEELEATLKQCAQLALRQPRTGG